MNLATKVKAPTQQAQQRLLFIVFAAALVLRLLHLAFAIDSPLTYQLGPDEDFYLRFGRDVAFGCGGMSPEFAFMDPLYGYLLGGLFRVGGGSLFLLFLVQALLDVLTTWMVYRIGRRVGLRKGALLAAGIYAAIPLSIMYTTTVLKPVWVSAFTAAWMLAGLRAEASSRPRDAAWFGLLTGLGVALRANLLLLVPLIAAPLILKHRHRWPAMPWRPFAAFVLALSLPLFMLGARNANVSGNWSITPNNGGIVLHQLYNPDNPLSVNGGPRFVHYGHPAEIWRNYAAEAVRRNGADMRPKQIDAYWRGEAIDYMLANPGHVLTVVARKAGEYAAWTDAPNNRSMHDESRFSPVLRWLPLRFPLLLVAGLAGLVAMLRDRREGVWLWLPVLATVFTFAVFFPETRFRVGALPSLAVGTAFLIERWRTDRKRHIIIATLVAAGAWSLWASLHVSAPAHNWQRMAWGYIKSHRIDAARTLLDDIDVNTVGRSEFDGYFALVEKRYADAAEAYEHALCERPGRHEVLDNLSQAYEGLRRLDAAIAAQRRACALSPRPEYRLRLAYLLDHHGERAEAVRIYRELVESRSDDSIADAARDRLRQIEGNDH